MIDDIIVEKIKSITMQDSASEGILHGRCYQYHHLLIKQKQPLQFGAIFCECHYYCNNFSNLPTSYIATISPPSSCYYHITITPRPWFHYIQPSYYHHHQHYNYTSPPTVYKDHTDITFITKTTFLSLVILQQPLPALQLHSPSQYQQHCN